MSGAQDQSREDFLAELRIAVLATENMDGSSQLSAVWWLYEDGAFHVPTNASAAKARNARERGRGAIAIDARFPQFRGVVARGPLAVIEGASALAINARVHRRFLTERGLEAPDLGGHVHTTDDVTLQLTPEHWSDWDMTAALAKDLLTYEFFQELAP